MAFIPFYSPKNLFKNVPCILFCIVKCLIYFMVQNSQFGKFAVPKMKAKLITLTVY